MLVTSDISCCLDTHIQMKKERLTQRRQFEEVYSRGGSWANKLLVMRASPNGLEFNRYGLSVSKRIGNAVIRNHVKRLIRENIRQRKIGPGWDVVFIARSAVAQSNYHSIENAIEDLLHQAKLQ